MINQRFQNPTELDMNSEFNGATIKDWDEYFTGNIKDTLNSLKTKLKMKELKPHIKFDSFMRVWWCCNKDILGEKPIGVSSTAKGAYENWLQLLEKNSNDLFWKD